MQEQRTDDAEPGPHEVQTTGHVRGATISNDGHKSPTRALLVGDAVYQQTFQSLPISLALLDEDGWIIDVNERWRAFARDNGGDFGGYVGTNYVAACHDPGDPEALEVEARLKELLAGQQELVEIEYPCDSPSGRRWFLMQACRCPHTGQPRYTIIHIETTQWRLAEQAEHQRADTDALTGVVSRGAFDERARQMLAQAERDGSHVALLFVDMDYYKAINDAYGHDLGDRVLAALAERLRQPTRESDLLARYGGDEFVILGPGSDEVGAQALAERLHQTVTEPVAIGDYRFCVSCSQGIAIYPDHGRDLTSLVNAADAAMYRAKRAATGYAAVAE